MTFSHWHTHSYYSLMDGLNSPMELFQTAKMLGQEAMGITDHGTLSSHREAQEAGQETGVRVGLGLEAYISQTDRFDRRSAKKRDDNTQLYNHLILIAQDEGGLKNLNKLSELAWTEGFYMKPRIDSELLEQYGDGLIVLSGCMNGLIAKAIEREDPDEAAKWIDFFKSTFGDRFFIEVQPHNPKSLNEALLRYADLNHIKPVVTADAHFSVPSERETEEALLILSTSPKFDKEQDYANTKHIKDVFERLDRIYPDRPISFKDIDVFVMDESRIREQMASQDITREDIYANTAEIASLVGSYDYRKGLDLLPTPKAKAKSSHSELVRMASEGLRSRIAEARTRGIDIDGPSYEARLAEELEVIESKKFSRYFLVVADLMQHAREQGIFVGPGRGSAAGSLLCYVLGITDVDPIEFDLLFFRFIDPSRDDFPDVDMDFEDARRHEIKEYLVKKYINVANISTFAYFKDKGVVRDSARVFRVPLGDVNRALKNIDSLEEFERSQQTEWFRKEYPEVLPLAKALQGRIRSTGMHAAGVVVSKEPIESVAPIETRNDPNDPVAGRVKVVGMDMNQCASLGLIKMDLLGLTALSVVVDTLRAVKRRHGVDVELPRHLKDLKDARVFKEFTDGRTIGVFQAWEPPYRRLLMQMGVDHFEDLVASTALVRPGAMRTVGKDYLDRKQGKDSVSYLHPRLQPFTERTFGVIIYQEQVMQAATELGGLSMIDANRMRNIIGKKKDPALFEQFKDRFITGAKQHITEAMAEQLWHDFEAHSGYSFNRSHAVAYSLVTYWTMLLKTYYPQEFMWAALKHEGDNDKVTELLIEAKRLGIKILLPHVNKSAEKFSLEDDAIRFGLTNIKYISDKVAQPLVINRPFKSYKQLLDLSFEKGSGISSRTIMALNAIGAAAFGDNPDKGDEEENYYEFLNIPKFTTLDLPPQVYDKLTILDDYSDTGLLIVKGMVKKVKRGKGWSLVEMIDETGTAGVFDKESTEVQPGQQYFFLIADNRIADAIPIDELMHSETPFARYLLDTTFNTPGYYFVLKFDRRMTKAKKMMGTLVLAKDNGELRKVLVWPSDFPRLYTKVKEGEAYKFYISQTDDGALFVKDVI